MFPPAAAETAESAAAAAKMGYWNDVLDVLEHAFAANNITFFRMKGGRYDNLCRYYFSICLCIYTGLLDIHLEKEKKKILTRQRKNYDYDPIVLQHI